MDTALGSHFLRGATLSSIYLSSTRHPFHTLTSRYTEYSAVRSIRGGFFFSSLFFVFIHKVLWWPFVSMPRRIRLLWKVFTCIIERRWRRNQVYESPKPKDRSAKDTMGETDLTFLPTMHEMLEIYARVIPPATRYKTSRSRHLGEQKVHKLHRLFSNKAGTRNNQVMKCFCSTLVKSIRSWF